MASVEVTDISISDLLNKLNDNLYVTPKFQREFVWSENDVVKLATSVIEQKPVGMITLWRQEAKSPLPIEGISVDDKINNEPTKVVFTSRAERQPWFNIILDGKQRSTAFAMAFGWLRASNGNYRYSGRYFLDVKEDSTSNQIKYIKKSEIASKQLDGAEQYVKHGLFPLELDKDSKFAASMNTWIRYLTLINNKDLYGENFPGSEEVKVRALRLNAAYQGIIETRIAVYTVPESTSLSEICEIFDTLNQTGTKVSTLDLIHSWVYSDTSEFTHDSAVLVRDGIESIGELTGAEEWLVHPRLDVAAQMLACIQVGLAKPDPIRKMAGETDRKIDSIKAKDLLALSSDTWKGFFKNEDYVAKFLKEFQLCVANGRFSRNQCPYPGVAAIYIALRWHLEFENTKDRHWGLSHLNLLFKAFFWRNTFSRRYDQGSMTRTTRDITELKNILNLFQKGQSESDWAVIAHEKLENLSGMLKLSDLRQEIDLFCRNEENYRGALQQALNLLLYTRARRDFINPEISIKNLESTPQLHHIIPKKWWVKNYTETGLELDEANKWKDSIANLIPLSAGTNKRWGELSPATAFKDLEIGKKSKQIEMLRQYFVDEKAQKLLENGIKSIPDFLNYRSKLIADTFKLFIELR